MKKLLIMLTIVVLAATSFDKVTAQVTDVIVLDTVVTQDAKYDIIVKKLFHSKFGMFQEVMEQYTSESDEGTVQFKTPILKFLRRVEKDFKSLQAEMAVVDTVIFEKRTMNQYEVFTDAKDDSKVESFNYDYYYPADTLRRDGLLHQYNNRINRMQKIYADTEIPFDASINKLSQLEGQRLVLLKVINVVQKADN